MQEILNATKGKYHITTDLRRIDLEMVHQYLCYQSYWSRGIPYDKVETAASNSLNFGLFHAENQIGYARVITDYAQIAYLGDVFILEAYRGFGLGKWLVETIHSHPQLQSLRNWLLGTKDAHGLYQQFGWINPPEPYRWMIRPNREVYKGNPGWEIPGS
jgi:GNAT superfamily N-acetyltransferase